MCVFYVTSVVPDSLRAHALAHQAPLSMEFSRQEYWSGLPCPSLGDLPNPGVKPVSFSSPVLAGTFFISSTTAVLNLICDNWKYLYIFKCLLTYARVCVCVCVCVWEREKSLHHPDKHPVIDQTLLTLLSSFSTRPCFCVHLCTSSILLSLGFWLIPHPPWSPGHMWSPWSALTRSPARSG